MTKASALASPQKRGASKKISSKLAQNTNLVQRGLNKTVPCVLVTDWHFGEEFTVAGSSLGKYNQKIACTRLKATFDKLLNMLDHHANPKDPFTDLQIMLGGDMLEGQLRNRPRSISDNDLVATAVGLWVTQLQRFKARKQPGSKHLSAITIVGVVGNHGIRPEVNADEGENLDEQFYRLLAEACIAEFGPADNDDLPDLTVEVVCPSLSADENRYGQEVLFWVLDTPYRLTHGAQTSRKSKLREKNGVCDKLSLASWLSSARNEFVNNKTWESQKTLPAHHPAKNIPWGRLVQVTGHHHQGIIDSKGMYIGGGSLRGPNPYVTSGPKNEWARPSAVFWLNRLGYGVDCAQELFVQDFALDTAAEGLPDDYPAFQLMPVEAWRDALEDYELIERKVA